MPPEMDIARRFGVSRPVVRQAMMTLVNEGLIDRTPGKGTYVRRKPHVPFEGWPIGSIEDVLSYSRETRLQILSKRFMTAPPNVAEALQISPGSRVFELRAVRSSKEGEIAYQQNYVPEVIAQDIASFDFSEMSLFAAIEKTSGYSIDQILQAVSAVAASTDAAAALQAPSGAPLLQIERMLVSLARGPVEFGITCFRSDRYRHIANLTRDRSGSSLWREKLK